MHPKYVRNPSTARERWKDIYQTARMAWPRDPSKRKICLSGMAMNIRQRAGDEIAIAATKVVMSERR